MPLISSLNWILEKYKNILQPGSFSHQQERILEKISLNLKQQQKTHALQTNESKRMATILNKRPNQNVSMYSSEKQELKKKRSYIIPKREGGNGAQRISNKSIRGCWVAQSVNSLTLSFSLSQDTRVLGWSLNVGSVLSMGST